MTLIRNLFFLFSVTMFALAAFILNLFNYNPYLSSKVDFINFYVAFLLSVAGVLAIGGFYVKSRVAKNQTLNHLFWPSVRQGLFIAAGLTTVLVLQGLRILDWLVGISAIIVVVLLEMFFQTKGRRA